MFQEFAKIARLNREIIITEKIDGTNAQVFIVDGNDVTEDVIGLPFVAQVDGFLVAAGSRTRWITPQQDNHGFAKWVQDHAHELIQLGPGRHFGEWWGPGIQRGYGQREKRFSLFNTSRWLDSHETQTMVIPEKATLAPQCCYVVPVLYRGLFGTAESGLTSAVSTCLERLWTFGSVASPGFMRPEGLVVYHTAANIFFKVTLEKDEVPKSLAK